MATGRVKWFNNAKGYGFILSEEAEEDYFAHYSSIVMDGYKTLKAGQLVFFDILAGPKGSHAINIRSAEGGESPEPEPKPDPDPDPDPEPKPKPKPKPDPEPGIELE